MPELFSPLRLRDVTLPNRVVVSPLCMYSAIDGLAQPFHFAHLSTFARGKAGLVFSEATAISAEGRITPYCLGIWSDAHVEALIPITSFIRDMGCVPGIQLAHAGRKGSTDAPFNGGKPLAPTDANYWQVVGPSAIPVADGFQTPQAMTGAEIEALVESFVVAARRSLQAGFQVIELHAAHGYLLHSFLSPVSNQREDSYGGDIHGRMKLSLDVARAVRAEVGESVPLFFRISAIDGVDGGWSMDDSVSLSKALAACGIDIVDCSSGGVGGAPRFRQDDDGKPLTADSAREPGFQVPFAERIRKETDLGTMAVGVIIDPDQANDIVTSGRADLVALGREIMHNPFWPLHAAHQLNADPDYALWPTQYRWAVDRRAQIKSINEASPTA